MVGVATAVAFSQVSEQIREARFRADRTRLYLEVRDARNRSARGLTSWEVRKVQDETGALMLQVVQRAACNDPNATVQAARPPVEFGVLRLGTGNDVLCFDAGATAAPAESAIRFNAGGNTPLSSIVSAGDGRLITDWEEFPPEGAFEAARCDPDVEPACGATPVVPPGSNEPAQLGTGGPGTPPPPVPINI